jgi:hypothetical protein
MGAIKKMKVEMDLCTIYYIGSKNCEADAPDGTLRIEWDLESRFERVAP